MAFPQYATSTTVNFSTPVFLGSDWIITAGTGIVDVVGGVGSTPPEVTGKADGGGAAAYALSTMTGALKEVTALVSTPGTTGAFYTGVGMVKTATVGTSFDGYVFFCNFAAAGGELVLSSFTSGVETQLATAAAGTFIPVSGDKLGISFDGTTIRCYTYHSAAWTLRLTSTPGAPHSGNMYGKLYFTSRLAVNGSALDDFTIGSGVSSGQSLVVASGSLALTGTATTLRPGAPTWLRYRK